MTGGIRHTLQRLSRGKHQRISRDTSLAHGASEMPAVSTSYMRERTSRRCGRTSQSSGECGQRTRKLLSCNAQSLRQVDGVRIFLGLERGIQLRAARLKSPRLVISKLVLSMRRKRMSLCLTKSVWVIPQARCLLTSSQFMREGHFGQRINGASAKKVGVIYKNLTVKAVGAGALFVRTLPDAVIGTFGPDLYHVLCRYIPALARRTGETRDLIHDFTGCVRDGEMMLVLGRPGAGCSTFLKAISNNRESYAAVTGDVSYGGIDAAKQKKMYRGEVNYNPEDDSHMASLNVWQTFTFALMTKTKKKAREEIPIIANALLRMFGIAHTKYTLVGDEYTRGVSGGERKRVSIAETLASKSTVVSKWIM